MRRLICTFVVRIWLKRFSHDVADIMYPLKLIAIECYFSAELSLVHALEALLRMEMIRSFDGEQRWKDKEQIDTECTVAVY